MEGEDKTGLVRDSRIEATPEPSRVTVAEMAGALTGPESVPWLREQRGGCSIDMAEYVETVVEAL